MSEANQVRSSESNPSVLAVIVNYKSAAYAIRAVESLVGERQRLPRLQVEVVENASGDEEALREALNRPEWSDWVRLTLAPSNGGFASGNNIAIGPKLGREDTPDYFWLLNPDTEVSPDAGRILVDALEQRPRAGIAGSSFEDEDGEPWMVAFRFPNPLGELGQGLRLGPLTRWMAPYLTSQPMENVPTLVDWIPGASMMVRREVFETAGLMDAGYFLYYEETDFCLAAKRAGWETWYVPASRVMHACGKSTGVTSPTDRPNRLPSYWFDSRRRYFQKNHGMLYATASDLAFVAGQSFWWVRKRVERRRDPAPPYLITDSLLQSSPVMWVRDASSRVRG